LRPLWTPRRLDFQPFCEPAFLAPGGGRINNHTPKTAGNRAWGSTLLKKKTTKQNKILLIANESNYTSFPMQIAYKLIEAGRSKDILQMQGLSIDGLNNRENTTIQYIEKTNIEQKQIY